MDKSSLSGQQFLSLFFATSVLNNDCIIEEMEFEKKLYKLYFNQEYSIFFRNLVAKPMKEEKYNYVNLKKEFESHKAIRVISELDDNNKYFISLSNDEAKAIRSRYPLFYLIKMEKLFSQLNEVTKENNKVKVKTLG